jgi:hypothetical protein
MSLFLLLSILANGFQMKCLLLLLMMICQNKEYGDGNDNTNNNNNNNNLIASILTNTQKEAIYTDINELAVYSKIYYDIETVKSDPFDML